MIVSNVIYTDTIKGSVLFRYSDCNGRFDDNSDDMKYCRLCLMYLLVFSHEMTPSKTSLQLEGCSYVILGVLFSLFMEQAELY